MTVQRIGYYRDADKRYTWGDAAGKHEPLRALFPEHSPKYARLNAKLELTDEAWRTLCALNDFDRGKVADELLVIVASPNDPRAEHGRKRLLARLWRSRYPFRGYHYKITYSLTPDNHVLVERIWFDMDLFGADVAGNMQRNALYTVNRRGAARFTADFRKLGKDSDEVTDALRATWQTVDLDPTDHIETRHAAINGMQNDLTKAAWLMGTHLDVAYPEEAFDQYTLFHNPTDGFGEDMWESAYDKGFTNLRNSSNARHLASVLHQASSAGTTPRGLRTAREPSSSVVP